MLVYDLIPLILVAFTGACLGSFVTLASWRLPRGEDIVRKPSRCPHCDTPLKLIDLFPVFSWWIRRGRCGYCGERVSIRYPLIELITAALFVINVLLYGFTWLAVLFCLLTTVLMILIVTDFEHYIIPDELQIAMAILAIPYIYMDKISLWDAIYGGTLGLLTGCLLHYGYKWLRNKDGLGLGDVKLLAISGLWLGPMTLVPLFFYAGLLGVITALPWQISGRGARFPFGPAIAFSLYILILWPDSRMFFWNTITEILQPTVR